MSNATVDDTLGFADADVSQMHVAVLCGWIENADFLAGRRATGSRRAVDFLAAECRCSMAGPLTGCSTQFGQKETNVSCLAAVNESRVFGE